MDISEPSGLRTVGSRKGEGGRLSHFEELSIDGLMIGHALALFERWFVKGGGG